MKSQLKGKNTHRLKQNPTEQIAAELWAKQHERHCGAGTLPYLLGDGTEAREPTAEEWSVAATLMQWLGSPVGRSYVRDLSEAFERHDTERRRG